MNWRLIPRREGFCSSVPKLGERRARTAMRTSPSSSTGPNSCGSRQTTTRRHPHALLRVAAEDRFRAAAGLAANDEAAARMLLFERLLEMVGTFFDVRQIWVPPTKRRLDA